VVASDWPTMEVGAFMEEPGESARDHYLHMAEKMSRTSTPHSSNCGQASPFPDAGMGEFSWDDDGMDDLGLDWPGDEEMTEEDEEAVRKQVAVMGERGVRLLAIDNDLTLVSIHTGGSWSGTAEELAEQARPIFKIIIDEAMANDMLVSIVTFSSQPQLIEEMLQYMGLKCDVKKIIVRGGLNKVRCGLTGQELLAAPAVRARYQGTGKQEHVACAVQYFEEEFGCTIEPNQVLMIDDDIKNLEEAKKCGIQTAFFEPTEPMQMIESMDACPNAQTAQRALSDTE